MVLPYTGAVYSIDFRGLAVSIETTFGLTVEYDGVYTADIYVTSASGYSGLLTGICGNYDGDSSNDWTDKNGNIVSTGNALGSSFVVPDNDDDSLVL